METLQYSTITSPVGPLTVVISKTGIMRLEFGDKPARVGAEPQLVESPEAVSECARQLEEYFAGESKRFDLPLDLRGTEFQLRCWRALLDIPYGETRSYGEVAQAIGNPRAVRAVGLANGQNPIAIIVPCHRVIGANGRLTGYGGGLDVKRCLLDLERGSRVLLSVSASARLG